MGRVTPKRKPRATSQLNHIDPAQRYSELPSHADTLRILDQLARAYRQDILRLRAEYKHLRDCESAQSLAGIHLRYRRDAIDTATRSLIERYTALRQDLSIQRHCLSRNGD